MPTWFLCNYTTLFRSLFSLFPSLCSVTAEPVIEVAAEYWHDRHRMELIHAARSTRPVETSLVYHPLSSSVPFIRFEWNPTRVA